MGTSISSDVFLYMHFRKNTRNLLKIMDESNRNSSAKDFKIKRFIVSIRFYYIIDIWGTGMEEGGGRRHIKGK